MNTKKKKITFAVATTAVAATMFMGIAASAATIPAVPGNWGHRDGDMHGCAPGVFGTVDSVSGNTFTVTSKIGPRWGVASTAPSTTTTTYTIDASSATVTKDGAASTVSAIAVGDTVMVQGAINGTQVAATVVRDGLSQMGKNDGDNDVDHHGWGLADKGSAPPIIIGNGQPVIGGNVTALSGTTLTVTNKSNVTYSVDMSGATIEKNRATSTVSDIAVGDVVVVQGIVNGNTVVASSAMDFGATSSMSTASGTISTTHKGIGGFFGAIGGFFHNLFGFF